MILDTIDKILAVNDRPPRKVDVPQWDGSVFVRSIPVAMLDAVESMDRVDLVIAGLCDQHGNAMASTPETRISMSLRHPAAMDLLALEILKVSGLRPDESPAPVKDKPFEPRQWRAIESVLTFRG